MNFGIFGKGSWGSSFGKGLESVGHHVQWFGRQDNPGQEPMDAFFIAVPCQAIRERFTGIPLPSAPLISLSKGIEIGTGLRVSQILQELYPSHQVGCLSGPSFAHEIAQGLPSALVIAFEDDRLAASLQTALHRPKMRLYRSTDIIGIEWGGALKNVMALAAGICSGLQIGENAMAALLTRGLAEMRRVGEAMGARPNTMNGLSGVGDLMLTAYSRQSRNHAAGELIARGCPTSELQGKVGGVVEGIPTAWAVKELTDKHSIRAPIVQEVHQICHLSKNPLRAMQDLLSRSVDEE